MLKMKNIALFSIFVAIISKLTGFLRDILLSYQYGANVVSDAYMIAYTIPLIIVGLVGEAVSTGFVPRYTRIIKDEGKLSASQFTNSLISVLMIFATLIILTLLIYEDIILNIIFPGLSIETFSLATKYLNITIWAIYPLLLVYILMGIAQIKLRFLKLSLISLPMNIIFLISIILSDIYGTSILPIGILIGIISQLVVFYKEIEELKKNFKLNINFKNSEIKSLFLSSIPVVLGVSVNQLNGVVDMNMASYVQEGGISIINYSNRINTLLHGVIALTIANMCYPIFAKYINEKNFKELNDIISEVFRILAIILMPTTLYIIFFSETIVTLLYGRGSFTESDVIITSTVMQMYVIGVLPIAYKEILSRVSYSFNNTTFPFISALIGVITNITLNIILSNILGLKGLSLASSIAAIITTMTLIFLIKWKYSEIYLNKIILTFLKFIPITILLLIELSILDNLLSKFGIFGVVINIISTTILYFLLLLVFKVIKQSEFNKILQAFNRN